MAFRLSKTEYLKNYRRLLPQNKPFNKQVSFNRLATDGKQVTLDLCGEPMQRLTET